MQSHLEQDCSYWLPNSGDSAHLLFVVGRALVFSGFDPASRLPFCVRQVRNKPLSRKIGIHYLRKEIETTGRTIAGKGSVQLSEYPASFSIGITASIPEE